MAAKIQKSHGLGGIVLGAILLFCGLLIVILSAVVAGKGDVGALLGPWWAGLLFMIPGVLGVVSGITKNKCAMIAFLVLNIIIFIAEAIVTAVMGLLVAIVGVFKEFTDDCHKVSPTSCKCNHEGTTFDLNGIDGDCDVIVDIHGLASGVLAMMIIGCIVALAGSILGCVAVCCNNSEQPNTTVIIQQGGQPQQQAQPPAYGQQEPVKY